MRTHFLFVVLLAIAGCQSAPATNDAGGPPVEVLPVSDLPSAPRQVSATATIREAVVTWQVPASSGTSAISGYLVTSVPGGLVQATLSETTVRMVGLTNGTPYTFQVQAVNAAGKSEAGLSNVAATLDVPSEPRELTLTSDFGVVNVTFKGALSSGGVPVTGFVAMAAGGSRSYGGVITATGSSPEWRAQFTGLPSGNQYAFSIAATNPVGNGPSATVHQTQSCVDLGLPSPPILQKTDTLESPRISVVGDFTGDGKVNLVTGGSHLGFFRGNGNASFVRGMETAVGAPMTAAVKGDFDADGKLDLLVGTVTQARFFKGDGEGHFVSGFSLEGPADALASGLLNTDAFADAVIASGTQLKVLLGGPSGLAQKEVVETGGTIGAFALADLDADGKVDLISLNNSALRVEVRRGNGDGTFNSPVTALSGTSPMVSLSVGRFNDDLHVDLAVVSDEVRVLFGDGTGALSAAVDACAGTQRVVAADLDGDGRDDLISSTDLGLDVFFSDGAAGFVHGVTLPAPHPSIIAASDLDGDTRPDLIAASASASGTVIFLNAGTREFRAARTLTVGRTPFDLIAGGFGTDLAVVAGLYDADHARWDLSVLRVPQSGPPVVSPITVPSDAYCSEFAAARLNSGDFNNDGKTDLLVSEDGRAFDVMLSTPSGAFNQSTRVTWSGDALVVTSIADFNGDSFQDVAFRSGDQVRVFPGHGDGTFAPSITALNGVLFNGPLGWVVSGDFNEDGKPDLAGRAQVGGLFVSASEPGFNFGAPIFSAVTLTDQSQRPLVADVNGDQHLDLITASTTGLQNYLGDGTGHFTAAAFIPSNLSLTFTTGTRQLALADFDGDGQKDVAAFSETGATGIFFGRDGTFPLQLWYPAGSGASTREGLAVGDFNGDSRPDVVSLFTVPAAATRVDGVLNVQLNRRLTACY